MGALFLLPLSPPLPLRRQRSVPPKPSFCLLANPSSSSSKPPHSRKPLSLGSSSGGNGGKSGESPFLDEDGAVEDMDGYLNYLSLEYDSVWDTKPSWCQPWTILLTGVLLVACSWVFLHSAVITAGAFSLICMWWYIFLYLYPKAYSNMIAERRKNVTSGIEDTFGLRKSQ